MSEVLNIEQLRKMAIQEISIPGFNGFNNDTINIKVQKPRLLDMAAKGKIPNPLMAAAAKLVKNGIDIKKADLKETAEMIELYCRACMVNPKYEELESIMTDDQKFAVFLYATGQFEKISSFRKNKKNGSDNTDGKEVQQKA